MLKILTWEEVEARCCGEKTISIESLKSITDYDVRDSKNFQLLFYRVKVNNMKVL